MSSLLDLKPLARQHALSGEYCDLLGVSSGGQVAILELKNEEDRYVVSQVTRYYDALYRIQPFTDKVNYALGIRLIIIAPSLHRHNYIDQMYNKLSIELWQFKLEERGGKIYIKLQATNKETVVTKPIATVSTATSEAGEVFPGVPRGLLNMLSGQKEQDRKIYLTIREQLLKADSRMQEITRTGVVLYGKKTRPCAEMRLCKRSGIEEIYLFFWLPIAKDGKTLGRTRILCNSSWERPVEYFHMPKGTQGGRGRSSFHLGEYLRIARIKPGEITVKTLLCLSIKLWLSRV